MSTTEPVDALETADAYPKYDEYEESGVEWLGEIPVHWDVERLKWTVTDCKNGYWGDSPEGDESDINTVRVADFDRFALRVPDQDFTVRSVPPEKRKGRVLGKGDLLLEKSGGGDKQPVGVVVLYDLDQPAVSSNFIARMPVAGGHDSSFLRYLHGALYEAGLNERAIKQSIGIQNLDADQYLNQEVGLPPLDEQRAIATFLDRETGRIDALIEKKEELIDLLEEKRTALISRVVTKGLDRDVEMQDSGVEWLSEIPGHWKTVKLKYLTECLDNRRIPLNSEERGEMQGDIPYWGANGVVDHVDDWLFDEKIVLLGEDGAPFFEKNEPVSFLVDEKVWVNNHAHILKAGKRLIPEFLVHVLNAVDYGGFIGGSTRDKLNQSEMGNIWVQLPPLEEQRTIVTFLDRETGRIDTLIDNVEDAINQLEEYRTALISAAVTGQIDVREEVPTAPAE